MLAGEKMVGSFFKLKAITIALFLVLLAAPARAEEDGMTFIRDAEIEGYLRELGAPIFKAADMDPKAVSLLIIQDSDLNAFVAGGMNIFFYTGLLQATDTPEQLQGVLAHETGHISGGHLIRGRKAMDNASAEAIIGMLAGIAVGVASGNADVAIGTIGGAQSVAERGLLSYSRGQESAADAAAMRFLDRSSVSSQGLYEFMNKLAGQDMLPLDRQSQYVRTHPLSQDRVQSIAHHLDTTKELANQTLPTTFKIKHERMKAKLLGFLQPETALLRYTDKDPRLTARYARAIALYRSSQLPRALVVMDSLLKEEPENPFFIELKAQMLFENGRIKESADLYHKAVSIEGESALLRSAYAHALLEGKDPKQIDLAIQQLLEANRLEQRSSNTWRLLASAWSRKGEIEKNAKYQGLVSYALAEESITKGNDKEAKRFADRALKSLDKGSPYWLRAQDIKLSVEDKDND